MNTKKETKINEKLEESVLSEEELEQISGGSKLNPPRVPTHDYDDDVKERI